MILLYSLPRGAILFGMLLVCVCMFGAAVAHGELVQAGKVILPAFGLAILLVLRLRT